MKFFILTIIGFLLVASSVFFSRDKLFSREHRPLSIHAQQKSSLNESSKEEATKSSFQKKSVNFLTMVEWSKTPLKHQSQVFQLAVSEIKVDPKDENKFIHESALRIYAADILDKEIVKGNLPRSLLHQLLVHAKSSAVKSFVKQVLEYRTDRSYSDDLISALVKAPILE